MSDINSAVEAPEVIAPENSAATPDSAPEVIAPAPSPAAPQEGQKPLTLADLDDATPEQLEKILSGELEVGDPTEAGADVEPEPEAPAAEAEEEAPAEADAEPEEEEQRLPGKLRIKHLPESDRLALARATALMREHEGMTLAEALAQAGILAVPPQGEKPAAEKPEAKPAAKANPVEAARAEVERLEAQMDEAIDSLDTDAQKRLHREIRAASNKLALEEMRAQAQREAATQAAATAEQETLAAVEKWLPDFNRVGSELNQAANAEIAWLEKHAPDVFQDPGWPELVAVRAHLKAFPGRAFPAKPGANGAKTSTVTNGRPAAKVPPKPAALPAAMVPAAGNARTGASAADLQRLADSNNPEDWQKALSLGLGIG